MAVRGKLIVFEGVDRAGKSSQAARLEDRLRAEGEAVVLMRFPDRSTPIGSIIDRYLARQVDLPDQSVHLLFAANRWELMPSIESRLAAGTTVILDRYFYSGAVYAAAKQFPALPLSRAVQPDVGLARPDLLLFLDLDPSLAAGRAGFGGERYEETELQMRVKSLYSELLGWTTKSPPPRDQLLLDGKQDVIRIDANGTIEEVHQFLYDAVKARNSVVDNENLPLQKWQPSF